MKAALQKGDMVRFNQNHRCGYTQGKVTGFSEDGSRVGIEEYDYGGHYGNLISSLSYFILKEQIISVQRWISMGESE
jgi:hypothetical protein